MDILSINVAPVVASECYVATEQIGGVAVWHEVERNMHGGKGWTYGGLVALDLETRYALYIVGGRRCVWCGEPISFKEMAVEHLIPKSLEGDELTRVLELHGLPADYDLEATQPCSELPTVQPVQGRAGGAEQANHHHDARERGWPGTDH